MSSSPQARAVRPHAVTACVDGLSGFPEAIETIYPQAHVQPCIVHMVRNSLKYVSWKQRKAVADDLKAIYKAATVEEAELALDVFADTRDNQYPTISRRWRQQWEQLTGLAGIVTPGGILRPSIPRTRRAGRGPAC